MSWRVSDAVPAPLSAHAFAAPASCRSARTSLARHVQHQQKRLHRGLPFFGIVFGLGELGDVERGVAQRDQLATAGQFDWVGNDWSEDTNGASLLFHVLRNKGVELFAGSTVLLILIVPR